MKMIPPSEFANDLGITQDPAKDPPILDSTIINDGALIQLIEKEKGWMRIKSFLNLCAKFPMGTTYPLKYTYLFEYAIRYKLITPEFKINSNGESLLFAALSSAEGAIKQLLIRCEDETLSWMDDKNKCNGLVYLFSGAKPDNNSYQYALFLRDLGIIDPPEDWIKEGNQVTCRLTDFGIKVYKFTMQSYQLQHEGADLDYTPSVAFFIDNHSETTTNINNKLDLSTTVGDYSSGPIAGGIDNESKGGDKK